MKVELSRYLPDIVNQNIVHRDRLSPQMCWSLKNLHVRETFGDAFPDVWAIRIHQDLCDLGALGQRLQDVGIQWLSRQRSVVLPLDALGMLPHWHERNDWRDAICAHDISSSAICGWHPISTLTARHGRQKLRSYIHGLTGSRFLQSPEPLLSPSVSPSSSQHSGASSITL